jgi:N-alpha-acetyltransferase 38, NatC auxiliary subunit
MTDFQQISSEQVNDARQTIKTWLNKSMRVSITDGRVLVGVLLCTDRDQNLILGSCNEYIGSPSDKEEFRVLGLALVPGQHIQSIHIDENSSSEAYSSHSTAYKSNEQNIDDDKTDG